jgi:NADH-quinone oxidoreductase subunit J
MTGQEIVFSLLGVVAVGSAVLVVTTRLLVHAALWLVVYVGAVIVLLLFGIMLTRAPIGASADLDSGNRWAALAVAVATAAVLVTVMVLGFRDAYTPLEPGGGSAEALGAGVFRTWVLPFEVLSVLLLAALVGAIVLSRSDIGPGAGTGAASEPGPEEGER